MKQVEFFFDVSSPWTYIAFHNIQTVASDAGAKLIFKPFLVGGVFNQVNDTVYQSRMNKEHPKMLFSAKSLKKWAKWSGLELNFPSQYHPVKSVNAMRVCCALEDNQPLLHRFATAAFEQYFVHQKNIDDPAILEEIVNSIGENGELLLKQASSDAVKAHLRKNTQAVIDRGGFGTPTIFVNKDDMYFGNDQLPLVKAVLSEESV